MATSIVCGYFNCGYFNCLWLLQSWLLQSWLLQSWLLQSWLLQSSVATSIIHGYFNCGYFNGPWLLQSWLLQLCPWLLQGLYPAPQIPSRIWPFLQILVDSGGMKFGRGPCQICHSRIETRMFPGMDWNGIWRNELIVILLYYYLF